MNMLSKYVLICYDLLFPRDKDVAICDNVTREQLEQYAQHIHIDMPFPCIAPLPYKNILVKNMVQASKYHSHIHASFVLGEVIARFLSEELAERNMFNTFTEPVFVPIPLHKKRQHERGYNQAERITQSVFKNLGIQGNVLEDVLIRQKHTLSQSYAKSKKERFENMKNAFSVIQNKNISGKDIVLIDDVITTGATCSSARNTLLQAGAREVLCVAGAH